MDASKHKITERADFEVLDAGGDVIYLDDGVTPWTITVASPGTKKATKAAFELKQAVSGDLFGQLKGKKSSKNEDSETILRADFLMKITESTNAGNLVYEGKTGMDALRAIYLDPLMAHVAEGVEAFHQNRGNFKQGSATSSPNTFGIQPG